MKLADHVLLALVSLTAAAWFFACGEASGDETGEGTGGGDTTDTPTGPSDDAPAVEVEVPVTPRIFLLGAGLPVDAIDLASSELAWEQARLDTDVVSLWFDGGVPWAEMYSDAPLPAIVDAWLTELSARLDRYPGEVFVIVDALNPNRTALVGDLLGRTDGPAPALGDVATDAAYARWVSLLAARLGADRVAPLVEPNLLLAGRRDETEQTATIDGLVSLYTASQRAVQDAAPETRVFPIWDAETLELIDEEVEPVQRSLLNFLDERQDALAVTYNPADGLRTASDLAAGEFAYLSTLSRRPIAFVGTGYPAVGFTRNDQVFASSENSQYNYMAWLFAEAEALDAELVVWRTYSDPDDILRNGCSVDDADCIAPDSDARLERWRATGLRSAAGTERRGLALWRLYRERPIRGR